MNRSLPIGAIAPVGVSLGYAAAIPEIDSPSPDCHGATAVPTGPLRRRFYGPPDTGTLAETFAKQVANADLSEYILSDTPTPWRAMMLVSLPADRHSGIAAGAKCSIRLSIRDRGGA
jgi:hypothetical protein